MTCIGLAAREQLLGGHTSCLNPKALPLPFWPTSSQTKECAYLQMLSIQIGSFKEENIALAKLMVVR